MVQAHYIDPAVGSLEPTAIAAECYACPGCGRDPLVTFGHDRRHTVISCGVHDCTLPHALIGTGNTPAEAVEVWNRRALDCGDWLSDAETDRFDLGAQVITLPTTPRANAAYHALCAATFALTPCEEVARAVAAMEAATDPHAVVSALMWIGIDDREARFVAAGLGYPVDGSPLVTCWECRRPLSRREPKYLAGDGHGHAHWLCSDDGRPAPGGAL